MSSEYDKLTIGDTITINIKELVNDSRFQEKKETKTALNKFKLNDLKFENVEEKAEWSGEDDSRPFIAVYLFGLIDGYQKLDYINENESNSNSYKVRYYHYNVVSKYVEKGKEEFLDIISEIEEEFRSSRKVSKQYDEEHGE